MKYLVGMSAFGAMMMTAAVPAYAAEPDEATQLVCDLTGDCGGQIGPDAAQSSTGPQTATSGKPRTSATRGFSFQRAQSSDAAPVRQQPAATVAATAPVGRPVAPKQVGSADLKLTFVSGSSVLTEPAKARLARYASVLASARFDGRRMRIEGHTDASGSARVNQDLSRKRAQTVADYLISAGVERKRIDVVGYGSSRPLPGIMPTAAQNRRVMAVLL